MANVLEFCKSFLLGQESHSWERVYSQGVFSFFSSVVNIEEQQTTFSLNLKKNAHTVCTPYVAKFTLEMLQYANNTMLRAQSARKIFV